MDNDNGSSRSIGQYLYVVGWFLSIVLLLAGCEQQNISSDNDQRLTTQVISGNGGKDGGDYRQYHSDDEGRERLFEHSVRPKETKGAPYPPAKPSKYEPNVEQRWPRVPDGPRRGDMKPSNEPVKLVEADIPGGTGKDDQGSSNDNNSRLLQGMFQPGGGRSIDFKDYKNLRGDVPNTSGCCPELSVAENGETIMVTANVWMALSEDGGNSFNSLVPSTLFPQSDGGLCCDQVVQYVPEIDMFVWLMQYRSSGGTNRLRMAAQTTSQVRSSNGTAWTYWDFPSTVFTESGGLDYNDMSFGNNSLWWSSQRSGRRVVRIPLSQIAAKSTINYSYTGGTDALWSHVTHNATNTVYWAGHLSNSQLRVYSMRDGDNFYSWRTVNINSWPNGTNSGTAPDGTDWLTFENTSNGGKHYVYGNVLQDNAVWFGWLASAGGGFPQAHIQLVKINTSNWTLQQQSQVWNRNIAFLDPYLSTNSRGEIGMSVGFGGENFYGSHAVGVWGDFVVYYPRLSERATSRWGDYSTVRRSGSNGREWVAAGYTNELDSGSNTVVPHYIRFGR